MNELRTVSLSIIVKSARVFDGAYYAGCVVGAGLLSDAVIVDYK